MRASIAQVPAGSFGDDTFLEPMRTLLDALEAEAALEPMGQFAASARLITALNRRRRLAELLELRPEVRDQPIEAPIFVLGFPRTGTTLLHNLLAADARNRAVRLWEMREPVAPPDASESWARDTIATTEQLVEAGYRLSPRLVDIHPLRATWPDECSWLFRNGFASLVFGFSYFVPSYLQFMYARDARPDYAYFRLQLQAILSQRPGQPLVLKDPCHIWNLDALLETFPDARIIHLHRRLEEVVPSFASLCHALQEGGAKARPLEQIGAYAADMLEVGMQRMLAARERLGGEQILDLDYRDLVRGPLDTLAKIYSRFGLELDAGARASMDAWLETNRGLSGKHHYSLEMFGFDADALSRRFSPYNDTFAAHVRAAA